MIHNTWTWNIEDIFDHGMDDALISIAEAVVLLKSFYSVVRFVRISSIRMQEPDFILQEKAVLVKVALEVEGLRTVEQRHRRLAAYENGHRMVEFVKECSAHEGRVSEQELRRLLTQGDMT